MFTANFDYDHSYADTFCESINRMREILSLILTSHRVEKQTPRECITHNANFKMAVSDDLRKYPHRHSPKTRDDCQGLYQVW
jgi:hypothetical protein